MIFKDNIHVVQTDIRIQWCSWSDMPLDVTPPQKNPKTKPKKKTPTKTKTKNTKETRKQT